jgi:hypothetical protein
VTEVVAALAAAALVYAWWPLAPPPRPAPPIIGPEAPASDAVRSLLDGLAPGQELAGWEVVSIGVPREGDMLRSIAVRLRSRDAWFTVWIARDGVHPFRPRAETARYDLFYGAFDPPSQQTPPHAFTAAVDAIAERVKRREELEPTPEGL